MPTAVEKESSKRAAVALATVERDVTGYLTAAGLNGVVWKRAAVREMRKCAKSFNKGWNGDPRTYKHLPLEMVKDAYIEAARQGYEPGTHCYFVMYGGSDPALNVLTSYQGVYERVNAIEGVSMRPPVIVHEKDRFRYLPRTATTTAHSARSSSTSRTISKNRPTSAPTSCGRSATSITRTMCRAPTSRR